ncbi:MAG TPA: LytR C-terminal domain-containing protein, partial [Gemmatimonadaceae bacterium]
MARRPLKLAVIAAAAVVVLGGATALGFRFARARGAVALKPAAGTTAPDGVRVRVQVLNASSVRGLARRATLLLRDHGFDVVEAGT